MVRSQAARGASLIHPPVRKLLRALWSELDRPPGDTGTLHVGIDVVEVAALARQLEGDLGRRFVAAMFTAAEIEDSRGRYDRFATRWALKEAVSKAIGSGFRNGLRPSSIEVVTASSGAVSVRPAGATSWPHGAADWAWAVSASHESGIAAAIAIATSTRRNERETHA